MAADILGLGLSAFVERERLRNNLYNSDDSQWQRIMLSSEERETALIQMEATVDDFYRQAVGIHNHPFIEFAGIMQAYIKTCRRAHKAGIDFSECNRHSGNPLPMESFEITYLNEKLNCIFHGRISAHDD